MVGATAFNFQKFLKLISANFSQRFQNNERPVSAYDQVAFPKVRVNEEGQVAGKKCQLRKTDYYYMTFSGKLTNPKKGPNVAFTYKDLPIQLTFVSYDIDRDESLYRVTNLADLDSLPAFKALANEWRGRVSLVLLDYCCSL